MKIVLENLLVQLAAARTMTDVNIAAGIALGDLIAGESPSVLRLLPGEPIRDGVDTGLQAI